MLARLTVLDALDDGVDFARDAWRDAYAPMALTALGWTLLVVATHARIALSLAAALRLLGLLLLLFHLPLWGGLYRQALGLGVAGQRGGLGPGGLQLWGVEARMLMMGAVFGLGLGAVFAAAMLIAAVTFLLLRGLGGVTLGPLGHWAWWFLAAAVMASGLLAGLAYLCARLSLALPLSLKARRITPWAGWDLTEGQCRPIAAAFIAAHVPMLLVWLGLTALGWIEPSAIPPGLHGAWPVVDALGAGLVAGGVLAVVQAPLSVGVIAFAHDMLAADIGPSPDPGLDPEAERAPIEPEPQPEQAADPVAAAPTPDGAPVDSVEPDAAQAEPATALEPEQSDAAHEPPPAAPMAVDRAAHTVPPLDGADEAEHATA